MTPYGTMIFVTGFHRAGTHSFARHIAKQRNLKFIDECEIDCGDLNKAIKLVNGVLQCPGLAHEGKVLARVGEVFWCTRKELDLITSMKNFRLKKVARVLLDRFYKKYPDDPIWPVGYPQGAPLPRNASQEVIFFQHFINLKTYFLDKYFKDLVTIIPLEEQIYYHRESSGIAQKELTQPERALLGYPQAGYPQGVPLRGL